MALNTAAKIARLRGLTAKFDNAVAAATPIYPRFCTTVQSQGADEQYAMLGSMPGVREWLGDRQFGQLRAAEFTLKNRPWETSLAIEKYHIDDDRLGMYDMTLAQLGAEASHHPDELLFEVLEAGESEACFDGQYFFDTDHAWGDSGTQSNDLTATVSDTSAVTETEFRTAYHAARAAMLGFKRDNGKPYHRPTIGPMDDLVLMLHPSLEEVAHKAISKQLVSGGETNIILDRPQIITGTYLTSAVKFYLFRVGQPLKPFVFQARQPLQRQMKGLDDREFKDVKFMTDARYNVGYLAWWNAVLTTFTT